MYFNPIAGSEQALLITEQLLVFATVIGSVGMLPALIEFVSDRRKRKERIDLSLEDEAVDALRPRLAGMDALLGSIEDLVDRARHPEVYEELRLGNEVLIIGPAQSGKKSLAQTIAKRTGMERLVTVYNPRDSDALAEAKSLVRGYKWKRVMLLLPRIDLAYKESDPEVLAELDALIESTSERANVLVVATATTFVPDSDLDNTFGIKLVLPGAEVLETDRREIPPDAQEMLEEVAAFYLGEARRRGFALEGLSEGEYCRAVLEGAMNPAEIEDIVTLCETTALYRRRTKQASRLVITPEILDTAIGRVVVG